MSAAEIKEIDVVRLTRPFAGLPEGHHGAVVCEYDKSNGEYYEIEFVVTEVRVLTVPRDAIELVEAE